MDGMTEVFVNFLPKKFYKIFIWVTIAFFGHYSGHEKFVEKLPSRPKHGMNLVWLAFHDPAHHTSSVIL